ncbi:hypothetical protein EYF80_013637 [Liparis tanakae]|uniref:Uncharacterized protein n=1 Tax=Liparis tanakae TaxID=230148 RepID=A0A4Z2IDS2_9TELE|nr:hypothetical protein EYF80_013637 [Liparis tanakae]
MKQHEPGRERYVDDTGSSSFRPAAFSSDGFNFSSSMADVLVPAGSLEQEKPPLFRSPPEEAGDGERRPPAALPPVGSEIQRRFVLHVSQHRVSARLAKEVGDGGVLSPHCEMQGSAAVKHGSIHIGSPAEQQLH